MSPGAAVRAPLGRSRWLPFVADAEPPISDEPAKQLSNPVADVVSIPFQFNWENGVGPDEDVRYILNVQPVVPFKLCDDLNLIGR